MPAGLLLDTCALIWIANGDLISEPARAAIADAERNGRIYVSPISAWEVGTLAAKGRIRLALAAETWFDRVCGAPAVELTDLSVKVLIRSTTLPGTPPADPADRIIISTARELGVPIVTRDKKILAYSGEGWTATLSC